LEESDKIGCQTSPFSTSIANRIFDLLPPNRLRALSRISKLCRIYKKSELLTNEPDEDYTDDYDDDDEPVYASRCIPTPRPSIDEIIGMMTIEGSKSLQQRIREIVTKYWTSFSVELSPDPAKIPPMELAVDRGKWQVRNNSGPPRNQSTMKQEATIVHVKDMLDK
jgi:hypothetical protein